MADTKADTKLAAQYRDAVTEHQGIARMFHEAAERLGSSGRHSEGDAGRMISLPQAREQLSALREDSDACALGARAIAIVESLAAESRTDFESVIIFGLITQARELAEGR